MAKSDKKEYNVKKNYDHTEQKEGGMEKQISRKEALELLRKYNKEPFHIRHALTVEAVMKYYEIGRASCRERV